MSRVTAGSAFTDATANAERSSCCNALIKGSLALGDQRRPGGNQPHANTIMNLTNSHCGVPRIYFNERLSFYGKTKNPDLHLY